MNCQRLTNSYYTSLTPYNTIIECLALAIVCYYRVQVLGANGLLEPKSNFGNNIRATCGIDSSNISA